MEDLLIKSYNAAQASAISDGIPHQDAVNAVLSGGSADNAQNEEEASSTTQPENENDEEADLETAYNVGDFVRCTYSDGVDYEAKIIKINYNRKTCRIRYIGYENEQTVKWDVLVASWGEEARNAQYEAAKAESTETEEVSNKKSKTPIGFNPPPVPPIPPMLFDSDDEEKNQQFAQLLISWFMTGYYTGLHQRNMQAPKK